MSSPTSPAVALTVSLRAPEPTPDSTRVYLGAKISLGNHAWLHWLARQREPGKAKPNISRALDAALELARARITEHIEFVAASQKNAPTKVSPPRSGNHTRKAKQGRR